MGDASRKIMEEMLDLAGIRVDGSNPWDMRVHQPELFDQVAAGGSMALGNAYVKGAWDCPALDQFFDRILKARLDQKVRRTPRVLWASAKAALSTRVRRSKAFEIGKRHYDLGNDLFEAMLDPWMNYSCGYWRRADDLVAAQRAKMDLIAQKLKLEPGMSVLDIGCGWGGFDAYIAENYGVKVTGVTVSRRQKEFAERKYPDLPARVELQDYRDVQGKWDRVVSIGMFEHVGATNYRTFFEQALRLLDSNGLMLLHTIGANQSRTNCDPWIEKYIFPNSMLPSSRQITEAAEELFMLEDWHNLGPDYDPTLMSWRDNFHDAWPELKKSYDSEFFRMWSYYLLSCAGSFRSRRNQLWQIVFSPAGYEGQYRGIR